MTAVESFSNPGNPRAKDICSSCRHDSDCGLNYRQDGKPVLFCEEFDPDSELPKDGRGARDFVRLIPQGTPIIEAKDLAQSYVGLCKTCQKLSLCRFTKPGGGLWECVDYEAPPQA